MRPDKPGCYWWEDYNGKKHVVEFTRWMDAISPTEISSYISVDDFEELPCFKKWIGEAHPPKRVIVNGEWVRYDDVKEFLIG